LRRLPHHRRLHTQFFLIKVRHLNHEECCNIGWAFYLLTGTRPQQCS